MNLRARFSGKARGAVTRLKAGIRAGRAAALAARGRWRRHVLLRRLASRAVPVKSEWDRLFTVPMFDLGDTESEIFRNVLSPEFEIGAKRAGVDSVFLGDAEAYYAKHQGFDYWRSVIGREVAAAGVTEVKLIAEFGCGFGNSTLPLLELFPEADVVASDISPNLLAILNRLLVARGLRHRCVPVAVDALKPFMREGCADLVIGSAILHHLTDPDAFLRGAMAVLKPGGVAIFFEPLEGGYALLRLICLEIGREAERRGESNEAITALGRVAKILEPQIFREAMPGWRSINDKWAFPRSVLDALARSAGADLTVHPLHGNVAQFQGHITYMMRTAMALDTTDLPSWAWDIVARFDGGTFSPEMLTDLALEASLIFRKIEPTVAPSTMRH